MKQIKRGLLRLAGIVLPMLLLSGCFVYVDHDYVGPATLVMVNDESSYGAVWYAYAVPSASSDWGPELLGDEMLYPGDELVMDVGSCDTYYDLRAEYDDGLVIEKLGVWLPCDTTTVVTFID